MVFCVSMRDVIRNKLSSGKSRPMVIIAGLGEEAFTKGGGGEYPGHYNVEGFNGFHSRTGDVFSRATTRKFTDGKEDLKTRAKAPAWHGIEAHPSLNPLGCTFRIGP